MRGIINYFIKYPKIVTLFMASIIIFGIFGLLNMKSSFFPPERPRYIFIELVLPGASPEEIEESVVLKIEDRLKSVSGIDRLISTSRENAAKIYIDLKTDHKPAKILEDVKNAVNGINSFPVDLEPPLIYVEEIIKFAMSFSLTGSDDLLELKEEAERIERDLLREDGISKIDISGFPEREIEVGIDEAALRGYQITFQEVANAIRKANLDLTAGTIKGDRQEYIIRSRNKSNKAVDLVKIPIKARPNGQIIYLSHLATVQKIWADTPDKSFIDGKRSVNLKVNSTFSEDILYSAEFVRKYIRTYNKKNNQRFTLTVVRDGSKTLNERIDLLTKNGITGTILVFIVLALFLNFRLSFWVALGIPISFAGMFVLANFFGLTINVLSLFGMIIVVGILVDDGVVISENIYQHYERGKSPIRASIDGIIEVLPSVVSAVLTTCISFSIFFFIDGRMGDFFSDISFVVISTLLFSLVEAGLLLPAHIAESKGLKNERTTIFDRLMFKVEKNMNQFMFYLRNRIYAPVLLATIRAPYGLGPIGLGILIPSCAFLISIWAMNYKIVGFTMFPSIENDNVYVSLELPAGTPAHKTEELLQFMAAKVNDIEKLFDSDGRNPIEKVNMRVGPASNVGSITIGLSPGDTREIRNTTITDSLRKAIGNIPEADKLTFGAGSPFGTPIEISLRTNDLKLLERAKKQVIEKMKGMPELVDIYDSDKRGAPEIEIILNETANLLGISLQEVTAQVRQGFYGLEVQRLQNGKDEEKIWVRYKKEDRKNFQQLENMRIRLPQGEFPLREVASFKMTDSPLIISHLDGQREIRIYSDIRSEEVSSTQMIQQIREEVILPLMEIYPNLDYSFEGQMKTARKITRSLDKVKWIILLLMFIMIVLTFRSFSQSLIVLPILIPFSVIGVVYGHWFHGKMISILSLLGVVALIGVLINDSLVFISTFNQKIKRGIPFYPAVFQTGIARFRPILLTSVTTIAGLSPLIQETSFQAQFLVPMAISIAYGLAAATIQTLLMIPALLVIRNWISLHLKWLWTGKKPLQEEVEPAFKEFVHEKKLLEEN